MNEIQPTITPDHDLIIRLDTKLDALHKAVTDANNDTKERLVRLEESKLDKQGFSDFVTDYKTERADKERRIRFLERWSWAAWGVIGFIEFALILYVTFHH
jgi:hypothetical protein